MRSVRRDVKGHELPAERLCIHGRLVTEGIDEERIRRVELFDSLERLLVELHRERDAVKIELVPMRPVMRHALCIFGDGVDRG